MKKQKQKVTSCQTKRSPVTSHTLVGTGKSPDQKVTSYQTRRSPVSSHTLVGTGKSPDQKVTSFQSPSHQTRNKYWRPAFFFVFFFLFSLLVTGDLVIGDLVFADTAKENFKEVTKSFLQNDYSTTLKSSWRLRQEFSHSQYVVEAKYFSGLACLKLKRYKEAEKIFKSLSKNRRSKDKFYLGWANCYYLQEDWDKAVSVLQEALRRFPGAELEAAIYFKLGRCSQKKGEWGTAKYYFAKIAQKFPSSLEAKQARKILEQGEFYWTLQIGAFADRDNAQRAKYQLTQQGYPAFVSVLEKEWQKFYRLRVGRFDLRQEAEATKKNLEKEGYSSKIYP